MGLVSKIKKRQENKKKEKVKWTNVEAFKITEIEQSPALEAAEGVETCWKRSVEKITKQLGKDLPRFSNKIVFCTSEDYKLIENHFQENMNHIEPILSNSLLHSIPPDLFLSSEDLESLSHSESNIYKLKTTLLLFAFFFEGGYHSQAYQYILSNFDENLGNAKDLAFACEVFLEKTFIPEERENIDLEFPTKSKALNILRGVTQGHFSSVATGFQSRLGMKNITSNVHHVIYIILPDDEGCTTVLHYKIESGGWGNIRWLLSVKLDNGYNNLIEIEFNIDTLIFNDGTTDEKKEEIITALKPFFSPNLCNIFGLPMDFTLRGLNESMLKRWIDQMQNIKCKDLILDINLIDEIRYSFGHLSNTLISLSIAKNGLRNIPQSILELKNLEYVLYKL